MDIYDFQILIGGSKQFNFEGPGLKTLVITDYYTGETVRLDLGRLSQNSLDEILLVDDDEDEDEFM